MNTLAAYLLPLTGNIFGAGKGLRDIRDKTFQCCEGILVPDEISGYEQIYKLKKS